jgi:aspartate-semialdehyde dehydrogenase
MLLCRSIKLAERIALVGSETLLGREIEDVLAHSAHRTPITPYAANAEGSFGSQDGEAVFVEAFDAAAVRDHRVIVLGGTEGGARKVYALAKEVASPPTIIDCTGYLDHEPEVRIVSSSEIPPAWLLAVPHPAALAIAQVLRKLTASCRVIRTVAHVFEPASERGQQGIAELQQQTSSLLSFKTLEKKIFDAQLSFNLLSQYGEEAPVALADTERRIERHLATLLVEPPMPSLRLVQAPVFHGYSISLWVEFEKDCTAETVGQELASAGMDVRGAGTEAPTNADTANQSSLLVGDIRVDQNNSRAVWLWITCDNLRLRADMAVALAGTLTGAKPQ